MRPEQLAVLILAAWLGLNAAFVAWRLLVAERAERRRRRRQADELGRDEYQPWRDLRPDHLVDERQEP